MTRFRGSVTALCLLFLATASSAQDAGADSRYALIQTADGLIRLDTKSGEVSRCTGDITALACRLLPDERMAYEREITRLEDRIIALERRLDMDGGEAGRTRGMDLPKQEDLDEALTLAEQMMRRFFDMVRGLKDDMETDRL